jgi:outer membrane lipoprotein SlyB
MLQKYAPLIVCLAVILDGFRPASAQVGTQRGATLGGLAGAAVGGLIGDNNDKAGAGAAIGGLVGAVAGGVLGNASDKNAERRHQQYLYLQQQQRIAQVQSAVSLDNVVAMAHHGLSDTVIINQIRQRGFAETLRVADIIALHEQGVSEGVIAALQSAPGPNVAARPVVAPEPTIIYEHHVLPHYPPPRCYRRARVYHPPLIHFH